MNNYWSAAKTSDRDNGADLNVLNVYWPENASCVTSILDRGRIFLNLWSLMMVLFPPFCCWKHGLIFFITSIFISKIAPYFPGNHFILSMLKGLLSSANIFLIKAMLNRWAITGGKMHGWWQTKVTSEQQINYSLRKGAAIKDKVRPGVTYSVNDCVIYLWYGVVKAICWDLNTAISATATQGPKKWCTAQISDCIANVSCSFREERKKGNMTKDHRNVQSYVNNRFTIFHPRAY